MYPMRIKRLASSVVRVMVCPAAAAAAVRIFPARRGHQKRKEAAEPDPNPVRAVETDILVSNAYA